MDIGRLNRKVEILTFVWARDDFGGQEGTWVTTDVRWASIEVKITLRYTTNVTVLNRVRYGNSLYEIIGVSDDKTGHKATILNCKEIVNDGLQRKATEG